MTYVSVEEWVLEHVRHDLHALVQLIGVYLHKVVGGVGPGGSVPVTIVTLRELHQVPRGGEVHGTGEYGVFGVVR